MDIRYDEAHRLFHLTAGDMSYTFGIAPGGRLRHLYWGPALARDDSLYLLSEIGLAPASPLKGVDETCPGIDEVPAREPGDFSDPVLWICRADGIAGLRLQYLRHTMEPDHLTLITSK